MKPDPELFLRGLFEAALAAVRAEERVPQFLPDPPKGKTIVVGAGKAAASMAAAVEGHYKGEIAAGLVVTRYQHGLPLRKIECVEAGHPMPDDKGEAAARRMLTLAASTGPDDLLLCLVSGGGSALLSLPAPGLTMDGFRAVTKSLLECGATIHEINCVRKHISAIAGGRLARAANGAAVEALCISDVAGDDISVIASGPTVGDPTTFADALAVLKKYKCAIPSAIEKHLTEAKEESVKPGDPCLARSRATLIAVPQDALEAAAAYARSQGVTAHILGNAIEGEASQVGIAMAGIARQIVERNQPFTAPCVLLSSGETTVTLDQNVKDARGGRNSDFLLNFLISSGGEKRITALACDTDGIDGSEANAGAVMNASAVGFDARAFAARHDSYTYFEQKGALVVTGPTRTNVNDFRAVFIAPKVGS